MALTDMLRRYNPKIQIISSTHWSIERRHAMRDFAIPSGPESVLEAIRGVMQAEARTP